MASERDKKMMEKMMAAMREGFLRWVADPQTREAVRLSIAGQIKRRMLMEMAYAKGWIDCRTSMHEGVGDGE